jgi:hypothetical protein
MKAKYLKNQERWTAFTTINGLDVQEYGETEKEARENLANRIANSEFLLKGITLPQDKQK